MDVPNLVLDLGQIRRDALDGRLTVAQLLDIIEQQQQTIKRQAANERRLLEQLKQYEPQATLGTTTKPTPANTPATSYSLDAETKRRQRRRRCRRCRRKKSPGRQPTAVKFADAQQYRDVYPDGVRHGDCELVRERAV
jgi:TolA-binding protein